MPPPDNSTTDTLATWSKLAARYEAAFMDLHHYDDTYNQFAGRLNQPDARILDIGCGPGNISRYLINKHPAYRITAVDAASSMVELARKNVPGATCLVADARHLQVEGPFDGIVCGFCVPYLSEPECAGLLQKCHALLEPGGVLYFSLIEGMPEQSGYQTGSTGDSMYVYYYSETGFFGLLKQSGFGNIACTRVPFSRSNGVTETHLVFIAAKEAPTI